jgi:transcriptional regulator with XRE-family HTH domain
MDTHEPASDQPETLLDATYRLLAARDITLKEIAELAELDESWVAKFNRRAIPNPGVNLVQQLHDFLRDRANTPPESRVQPNPIHAAACP